MRYSCSNSVKNSLFLLALILFAHVNVYGKPVCDEMLKSEDPSDRWHRQYRKEFNIKEMMAVLTVEDGKRWIKNIEDEIAHAKATGDFGSSTYHFPNMDAEVYFWFDFIPFAKEGTPGKKPVLDLLNILKCQDSNGWPWTKNGTKNGKRIDEKPRKVDKKSIREKYLALAAESKQKMIDNLKNGQFSNARRARDEMLDHEFRADHEGNDPGANEGSKSERFWRRADKCIVEMDGKWSNGSFMWIRNGCNFPITGLGCWVDPEPGSGADKLFNCRMHTSDNLHNGLGGWSIKAKSEDFIEGPGSRGYHEYRYVVCEYPAIVNITGWGPDSFGHKVVPFGNCE